MLLGDVARDARHCVSAAVTLLRISRIAKIASRQQSQLLPLIFPLVRFLLFPERLSPRTPSSLGPRTMYAGRGDAIGLFFAGF